MPFYLGQSEELSAGLRRIACEQIDKALRLGADTAVPLPERAHYLRICCKKMRGLLRLARPLLGDAFDAEDEKYRGAAKQLAELRDMDVIVTTGQSLGTATGATEAGRGQRAPEAIRRCMAVLRECRSEIKGWPLDDADFSDIARGFRRTYRQCLDAWDAVLRDPTDANFHALRRRTKYHWYHVRILERLNKKKIRPRRCALRKLQLTLGSAHDLIILRTAQIEGAHPDREFLRQATVRKWRLYEESMNLAAEVYSVPAGRLVREFSRFWARRKVPHPVEERMPARNASMAS